VRPVSLCTSRARAYEQLIAADPYPLLHDIRFAIEPGQWTSGKALSRARLATWTEQEEKIMIGM
jgi:hypothetical protein